MMNKTLKKERYNLIKKVKVGQKQLGLYDDAYRDFLEQTTGKRSCADCSIEQLNDVLNVIKKRGVKFIHKNQKNSKSKTPHRHTIDELRKYCGDQKPKNEQEGRVFGIWTDICKAGKAKKPTPAGLYNLCQKVTDKIAPRFCDKYELSNLIEALKSIKKR